MKKKKIKFPKGVITIKFPVRSVKVIEEIDKILDRYELPKHKRIGFKYEWFEGDKKFPPLEIKEVYIEK